MSELLISGIMEIYIPVSTVVGPQLEPLARVTMEMGGPVVVTMETSLG
jgi:hypothetical protein